MIQLFGSGCHKVAFFLSDAIHFRCSNLLRARETHIHTQKYTSTTFGLVKCGLKWRKKNERENRLERSTNMPMHENCLQNKALSLCCHSIIFRCCYGCCCCCRCCRCSCLFFMFCFEWLWQKKSPKRMGEKNCMKCLHEIKLSKKRLSLRFLTIDWISFDVSKRVLFCVICCLALLVALIAVIHRIFLVSHNWQPFVLMMCHC